MTAHTTHSVHYEMIMKIMDDIIANIEECRKIIDLKGVPVKIRKNLQVSCDKQKTLLEKMAKELAAFENTNRILLKGNLVDEMTGLIQKKHLLPVIQQQVLLRRQVENINQDCIIVIDINNMKKLNEDYGHFGTDDILTELTKRMRLFLRENDYAFRVGGDEGVIYASNAKSEDIGRIIIRRMANNLKHNPIKAILLSDSDKENPPKNTVGISFCLGAVNLPVKMPNDIHEIKSIIINGLKEADALEIVAKNFSKSLKSQETVIAYKDKNGDTIIKTATEIMAK